MRVILPSSGSEIFTISDGPSTTGGGPGGSVGLTLSTFTPHVFTIMGHGEVHSVIDFTTFTIETLGTVTSTLNTISVHITGILTCFTDITERFNVLGTGKGTRIGVGGIDHFTITGTGNGGIEAGEVDIDGIVHGITFETMTFSLPVVVDTTVVDDGTVETLGVGSEGLGLVLVPVEGGSGVLTVVVDEGGLEETSVEVGITGGSTNTTVIEGTSGIGSEFGEVGIIITGLVDEVTTSVVTPGDFVSLGEIDIVIEVGIVQEGEIGLGDGDETEGGCDGQEIVIEI